MMNLMKLMRFVKGHWLGFILAFICLVGTTAFSLVIPKVLGGGVDTALSSGKVSSLIIASAIILGSSVLRGLTGYGNRYYAEAVSQQVAYDIRNALYNRLQSLSFAYHDQAQTGQLMSRATVDIEAVRNFISTGLLPLISTVLMVFGIAYLLITLDWRLALITLAFTPVIAWRVIATSSKLRPVWLSVQQNIATMGTILQENLMGIRVVKAFSRQKQESEKFGAASDRQYDLQVSAARIQAVNGPLMTFLLGVPTALVLWYGGKQVIAGTLTMGGITQFILYLGMLSMPIRRLGGIANTFSRSVSAGERITEILETESPVKDKPGAITVGRLSGQVTFENVSFSYKPELAPALENISFEAKPGQLIALLGGSGSGKSTLINLVSRFYDVTKGRITVDGKDVRDITIASLRKNIGIAQQDVFLFSDTIRNNIAYGIPDASLEKIIEAAKAAQINNFIQSLPDGYETWVGERGHTLSGGEKQRVAIARTLLINPAILILDDSTSAVDAETEHLIRLALEKLIVGRTTFIITHRLPIIKKADLILMLKDGHIEEMGKHDDLMAKEGLYHSTYISQLAATADSLAAANN